MSLACNTVMHGQHAHPPCPQHDCCYDFSSQNDHDRVCQTKVIKLLIRRHYGSVALPCRLYTHYLRGKLEYWNLRLRIRKPQLDATWRRSAPHAIRRVDLARRYEVASVASACILAAAVRSTQLSVYAAICNYHGQLITMKQDHWLISDVDYHIV